ncbi:hypothetical protein VTI28DRAFT_9556 [Corynascus sepedonium]
MRSQICLAVASLMKRVFQTFQVSGPVSLVMPSVADMAMVAIFSGSSGCCFGAFGCWNGELTAPQSATLQEEGLHAMLRALSRRFVPDKVTATRRYKKSQLTLKAVAADEQALPRFIGKKMRWARVMGSAMATAIGRAR